MPAIFIDQQEVPIEAGETILQAATRAGIAIPTLCHVGDGCKSGGSCMVCAVKHTGSGQFIPACAAIALDGMAIDHASDEVAQVRRMALELLLSDHLGDCLSPCERICPARLSIPRVLEAIRAGDTAQALAQIRNDLALAGVLCRVCSRPCEHGCRRGLHDQPVAISILVNHVIDLSVDIPLGDPPLRPLARVAILGSGFTGLSAAWFLAKRGHACTVIEASDQIGSGMLAEFPQISHDLLNRELRHLNHAGVDFQTQCHHLVDEGALDALLKSHAAVLWAAGPESGAAAAKLGLAMDGNRLWVDPQTLMTSRVGVFAAGRATRPVAMPAARVADGKAAAACISQFSQGQVVVRPSRPFSVSIGKLEATEIETFLDGVNQSACQTGIDAGLAAAELAVAESARCVHCHCAKAEGCQLRRWAEVYEANPKRFQSGERPRFERNMEHPLLRFEPGKCIRCGNCIQVAERHQQALGLTFIGRGFDVRVAVPMDASLAQGLWAEAAGSAVESCPTGAISWRPRESGS